MKTVLQRVVSAERMSGTMIRIRLRCGHYRTWSLQLEISAATVVGWNMQCGQCAASGEVA